MIYGDFVSMKTLCELMAALVLGPNDNCIGKYLFSSLRCV